MSFKFHLIDKNSSFIQDKRYSDGDINDSPPNLSMIDIGKKKKNVRKINKPCKQMIYALNHSQIIPYLLNYSFKIKTIFLLSNGVHVELTHSLTYWPTYDEIPRCSYSYLKASMRTCRGRQLPTLKGNTTQFRSSYSPISICDHELCERNQRKKLENWI